MSHHLGHRALSFLFLNNSVPVHSAPAALAGLQEGGSLGQARIRPALVFARTFLRHPVMLGSVIPSSRFLIDNVLAQVDWRSTRVIVEYGPGVGNFTAAILERMRDDGHLVAIERERDLATYLSSTLRDPRLQVVQQSAERVQSVLKALKFEQADCIISGIPYSTMAPHIRRAVLHSSYNVLRPGGSMIVYQFTSSVAPHLRELFGEVRQGFEPRNILPARIFSCCRQPNLSS
jgi:phospholipid N-methyltransferase